MFLARNGYRLNVSRYEVYQFTRSVAAEDAPGDGHFKLGEATRWIKEHLEAMT
jgi:prophage maintenance system killer protein